MFVVKRSSHNPVLVPSGQHYWEAAATFNLSPIKQGKMIYAFYRALSSRDQLMMPEQLSVIGLTYSRDGEHFKERVRFVEPEEEWEKFGCEDPRVTFFEGRYYIFYTALSTFPFSSDGIKVGVAISDDLKTVSEKHPVTPFNSKAMALFPERINGKATVIFSAHTDGSAAKVCIAQADEISEFWSEDFWKKWHEKIDEYTLPVRRSDADQVEVGAVPIKTSHGWLLIYAHIQNYFHTENGSTLFGIEALLFKSDNPFEIVGRTDGPIMVPEAPYELSGQVSNVIFPSGALVENEIVTIYYGASDTTVCSAKVHLGDLISTIFKETKEYLNFKRSKNNPIIEPDPNHDWESKATFNPAAIDLDGKVHLLYRALSQDNTSTLGYASSSDGLNIDERSQEPVYVPREEFEKKKIENANSGCEDPRLTKIGNDIYMCYTAFDGIGPPRVAVSSIKQDDFLSKRWLWTSPVLITPEGVDDKDTCILPDKFGGKYLIIHRIGTDICGDYLGSLDFNSESINKCIRIFGPRKGMWDSGKVGITAPPIKTDDGWLLLYHASSERHHTYRVGAVMLDMTDPTTVIARSTDPIFVPEMQYEKEGIVPNVVFPCGMIIRNGLVYIYYGGADKVTGVATMNLDIIKNALSRNLDN